MADDQYDFEDDNVSLSADPGHDGAPGFEAPAARPRNSKRGLIILLLLLVALGGGGFFAYQTFLAEPDFTPEPIQPIDATADTTNLPPQVTEAMPPVPVDPNATQPVPGEAATITPVDPAATPADPNAVAATALPTPAPGEVTDPNAATSPVPEVTAAEQANPADPVPAEAAKTVENDIKPTEMAVTGTLEEKPAVKEEAKAEAAPVMPAPPEQQLKAIDPQADVSKAEEEAAKPASQIKNVKNDVEKKTADTIAAVNDILGGALPSSGNNVIDSTIAKATGKKAASAPVMPAAPQEITSRAEQVIKVKKAYSSESGQAINAAGDRVLEANQYEAAVQLFDKQLNNNPSDPSALAGKAIALQKAGRDTEAMDAYQRLTQLNPRDVEALTNYLGLLQKQKPEEAMTRLNALSDQYPDNAAVSGQIGSVFASQMDTPNALRYFMKAQALDKTNPTYPFNIAVLYDRMGTSQKAGEYYRLALRAAQSYPENASGIPLEAIRNRLRDMH